MNEPFDYDLKSKLSVSLKSYTYEDLCIKPDLGASNDANCPYSIQQSAQFLGWHVDDDDTSTNQRQVNVDLSIWDQWGISSTFKGPNSPVIGWLESKPSYHYEVRILIPQNAFNLMVDKLKELISYPGGVPVYLDFNLLPRKSNDYRRFISDMNMRCGGRGYVLLKRQA